MRDSRSSRGRRAYLSGAASEEAVCRLYRQRGATCLAQRWRGQGGEIDLILRDGAELVFVEVKQSRDFARAAERLSQGQMRRIYTAASEFLATQPEGQLSAARFDVALVDGQGRVEIIENAFGHF